MKRTSALVLAAAALILCAGQIALSNGNPAGSPTISPQTLLLNWEQGGSVTVHTDMPLVGQPAVTLEGIAATSVYADNRGHLVARFSETAVEAIVAPPSATLTLYVDGVDVGSDTVRVIE